MRSQHSFSQVPSVSLPRSSFNLSHPHKSTFDADDLVPIMQPIDIIPGDTFNVRSDFFMRLATPLHPILDNLYFETFYFFVAYRIIWENFEKFHGAQDNPGDSTDFTVPVVGTFTPAEGGIADNFGLPVGIAANNKISSLPFRAYRKIWDDWFRDENLQDATVTNTNDGPDSGAYAGAMLKRGKRHDYLTSCLPWPQKGTAVSLPLGISADIHTAAGDGVDIGIYSVGEGAFHLMGHDAGAVVDISSSTLGADTNKMFADLTDATSATINDLRLAYMTQAVLENDARSGTRYVEKLKGTWGVQSPDFRLQRPEFLGGGSTRINVTPVAQTSGQPTPAADDALGNLAGFGTAAGSHGFTQSFVEHGVVIALGNVRADVTYFQGVDRYWSKQTAYEFAYPMLAGIGEQAVPNSEIYYQNSADDDLIWGYQERYGEYRYMNGKVTGLFRPTSSASLESWILTEEFTSLPTLGDTFIRSNTAVPLDRAIAIPTQPQIIADFFHNIKAARPLPLFGIPASLGRF